MISRTFRLTLTEDEALYVLGTLGASSQPRFGPEDESVYSTLFEALEAAGIENPDRDSRFERAYEGVRGMLD